MASKTGVNLSPKGVVEYSTVGGEVGITARATTPSFSNSRSRVVKTLAETDPKSRFKSPNRRGSDHKYHKIFRVQAPDKILRPASSGHPSGAGPDLLGR
jgi:hypothetical protein